jgi:hypothetical protein
MKVVRSDEISDAAKNATIDRAEFDATMKKLLEAKRPITKAEIARKVKAFGATRPSRADVRGPSHVGKRSDPR